MLNQITTIRLRDGREVALTDWEDTPLWSTLDIQNGATNEEMLLFQYVESDAVPAFSPFAIAGQRTATGRDTNIASAGEMASTEEMLVYAIRPEVFRRQLEVADPADFNALVPIDGTNMMPQPIAKMIAVMQYFLLLELEISQKFYHKAGFGYYNFGAGLWVGGGTGDPTLEVLGMKGFPSQEAVRRFAIPQHIGGQEKYRVTLKNPTGEAVALGLAGGGAAPGPEDPDAIIAQVRIYLDGLYKRPVS